jgi:lipooligosaccharide transport system permease protein
MNPIAAMFGPNARRVFRRNFLAWQKYAFSSMAINIIDGFVYFLAIGLGLGAYVTLTGHGSLVQFIAPGMLALTAMNTATFDSCWGCFERMNFNGVYESIVTAPVDPIEIAAGEYLWQAFRAALYCSLFLVAVAAFGLVHSWWVLACPIIFALIGIVFAMPGFFVAMKVATQEQLFFYFSFVVTPMIMIGGVFFPLDRLPAWVSALAWCTPLYHAVSACRILLNGAPTIELAIDVGWLAAFAAIFAFVPLRVVREKLGN